MEEATRSIKAELRTHEGCYHRLPEIQSTATNAQIASSGLGSATEDSCCGQQPKTPKFATTPKAASDISAVKPSHERFSLPDAIPLAEPAKHADHASSERRRTLHPEHCCGRRVVEGQNRGVQQQARRTGGDGGRGVEFVAEQWMADGLEVHPQLVRAAGFRKQFEAGGIARGVVGEDAQARQ